MKFQRHWHIGVGLVTSLAALFVGVVACSSASTPEPTAAVVATVAPTAVAPATATVVRPTSTARVSTPVVPTATLVPNATATPIPTTAYAPSPTPTLDEASTTEAEYNAARLGKLGYRAYSMALVLADAHSPRQSATDEELKAAMFLSAAMGRLGYETVIQDFEVTEAWASGSLEVLPDEEGDELDVTFRRRDGDTARIPVLPFEPLRVGIVEGELVDVGLGSDEDFEGVDVKGKIALMGRGENSFEEKETNAAEGGAIGAVVYNNEPRYYFVGKLTGDPDILASSITRVDGGLLFDALEDGEEFDVELIVYPLGNGPSRPPVQRRGACQGVSHSQQHLTVGHQSRVVEGILNRASGKAGVGALGGGGMEWREQGDRQSEHTCCECKKPVKASGRRNRDQPPVYVRKDHKSTAMPSRMA